jgi:diacylglycerol kinase family enzyme
MACVAVLLNPQAGAVGKGNVEASLRDAFAKRGLEATLIVPRSGSDLIDGVRREIGGASVAVAAGGDGTVNAVAGAVLGTPVRLGVIPLGTRNHFAKDLGLPVEIDSAVETIAGGRVSAIDAGEVNGRVFVNNSSLGLYPSLVQAREAYRARGHSKSIALVLASRLVLKTQHRVAVRVEAEGGATIWRTPFLFVGNNAYDVSGLRIAGRSRLDAGHLVAYLAPRIHVRDVPAALVKEWIGRLFRKDGTSSEAFQTIVAPEFWIETHHRRPLDVTVDGEVIRLSQPLHYRSRPHALHVLVPGSAQKETVRG